MHPRASDAVKPSFALSKHMRSANETADTLVAFIESYRYLVVVLFSICYFLTTCYRASRKLFWFDELFTVYISNLPSVGAMWHALLNGADFNPPLLYVLTRWSEVVVGHGPLGARFPEIVGFWIFCVCLFRFVSVRTNALAGIIAMLFPMVTTAYWYSYEARSHGLVLGFCGLALVCWQSAATATRRRRWWMAGLSASLICAMLTHSYAFLLLVPIGIGELTRTIVRRRIDWIMWLTLIVSSLAIFVSLPLLRAVHSSHGLNFFAANPQIFLATYQSLFEPAIDLLALLLVLLCGVEVIFNRASRAGNSRNYKIPPQELAAIFAFFVVPVFCFAASAITKAPMLARYSLQAVASVACIVGLAAARNSLVSVFVSLCLVLQIGIDFASFYYVGFVREPATSMFLSTSRTGYDAQYDLIAADRHSDLPVLLLGDLEFPPLFYYAPAKLLNRLLYVPTDTNGAEYVQLQQCCEAPGKVERISQLLSTSRTFLAYGPPGSYWIIEAFKQPGATVTVERTWADHSLFLVNYPPGKAAPKL